MGVWGRCKPPPQKAQSRHRGARSAICVRDERSLQDLPVATLLDSASSSPIAELAENTLAVLSPQATLGVALPPRGCGGGGGWGHSHFAPTKAKKGSCEGVF